MLLAPVFWSAVLLLGWVYLGYPVLVALVGRLRPLRLREDAPAPSISVAIAVHDEQAQIAARIADVLAQEGPGVQLAEVLVGSDGSTDATDAVVRDLAAAEPRLRLLSLPRGGQTSTQNALFEAARGEVVVLTDAETRFAPGCLAALARPFRDARVGGVTGRLEWRDEHATATSANEGLYWRYERRVRALESRAGFLTAVTGALFALRRTAYRPVPATASMDHLLPLYVREAGGLIVYEPSAVATDRPISGLREQFRNRSRTATRGLQANLSMARRLTPWRNARAATAIWTHKILRWATPWLLGLAAITGLGLALAGAPLYGLVPLGILLGLAAAAAGHLVAGSGRRPPRVLAFARAFAVVNLAFAAAWLNVLRGRRIETWHRAEWTVRS
ncbi:MAG TPA: glycosyltransferase [Candidatus Limnocylindrales bacterium]|nr:glycosyltransferase [Candidatus Limnocylindrales bacterium]